MSERTPKQGHLDPAATRTLRVRMAASHRSTTAGVNEDEPSAQTGPHQLQITIRPAYDIRTFGEEFGGIGRTQIFEEIAKGRLRATKIGRRTVIAGTDALTWLEGRRNASVAKDEDAAA